jgi:hypothetical protein
MEYAKKRPLFAMFNKIGLCVCLMILFFKPMVLLTIAGFDGVNLFS